MVCPQVPYSHVESFFSAEVSRQFDVECLESQIFEQYTLSQKMLIIWKGKKKEIGHHSILR